MTDTLLTQLKKHCDLTEIKCGYINLCYSYDFSNLSSDFKDFEPIVITKKAKLPVSMLRLASCNSKTFAQELNCVYANIGNDFMWDCSGFIWLNNGDWLELKATKNLAYFERHFAPTIPDELLSDTD